MDNVSEICLQRQICVTVTLYLWTGLKIAGTIKPAGTDKHRYTKEEMEVWSLLPFLLKLVYVVGAIWPSTYNCFEFKTTDIKRNQLH